MSEETREQPYGIMEVTSLVGLADDGWGEWQRQFFRTETILEVNRDEKTGGAVLVVRNDDGDKESVVTTETVAAFEQRLADHLKRLREGECPFGPDWPSPSTCDDADGRWRRHGPDTPENDPTALERARAAVERLERQYPDARREPDDVVPMTVLVAKARAWAAVAQAEAALQPRLTSAGEELHIVFSGEGPDANFVEVEDSGGRSLGCDAYGGRWTQRDGGMSALVIPRPDPNAREKLGAIEAAALDGSADNELERFSLLWTTAYDLVLRLRVRYEALAGLVMAETREAAEKQALRDRGLEP